MFAMRGRTRKRANAHLGRDPLAAVDADGGTVDVSLSCRDAVHSSGVGVADCHGHSSGWICQHGKGDVGLAHDLQHSVKNCRISPWRNKQRIPLREFCSWQLLLLYNVCIYPLSDSTP
jgi:hypothetical protein